MVEVTASGSAQDEAGGDAEVPAGKCADRRPKSVAAPKQDDNTPNAPLKFKLDKLQREHPYLANERGLTPETIIDFGLGYLALSYFYTR